MSAGELAAVDRTAFRHLYPWEPKAFPTPAGKLAYLDEGRGRPILCVHGNPSWSFYYRRLVERYRDRYRVVVPDHLGCGLSAKPQDFDYTIKSHVANLQALVRELDLKDAVLVGHDWGGAIGTAVAGREPDRFKALVYLNTAAFKVDQIPFRIAVCKWPVFGPLAVRGLNAFARAATTMAVARPMEPAVKAGFLAPYDSWENRIATLRFVQEIPMRPSHPTWATLEAIEADLPKLAAKPMKIFWGMQDFCFTPTFLEEWIRRFPAAEVERYADAGHYVLEDAHERILPTLDAFLARHAPQA